MLKKVANAIWGVCKKVVDRVGIAPLVFGALVGAALLTIIFSKSCGC